MAKKILYKVTAFHCMRCGGVTEPTKKYCEYCERELKAVGFFNSRRLNLRVLLDCQNGLVNFNDIMNLDTMITPQTIDCTTLEDSHRVAIKREYTALEFTIFATQRGSELFRLINSNPRKTRIEVVNGNFDGAYEMTSYVASISSSIEATSFMKHKVKLIAVDEMKSFDSFIPKDVLEELRCPNCGAPIKSRLCACDFCGGWSEVSWK